MILHVDMPDSWSFDVHWTLQLIQSDDPELKLQAAQEISCLATVSPSCKRHLSGAIDPLVSMLRLESHRESALQALNNLAIEDEENKINIVEAGALEPIITFLQSQCLNLRLYGVTILCTLSATTINKPVIGSSGAIPSLLKILGHGNPEAKINAIGALFNLSKYPDNLNIILGTNPIPPIVNLLKIWTKSSKMTEMCSALIESLVGFDEGRTALTSEEGGMLAVLEVFKFGSLQSKEHALSVLLTMFECDRCKYIELYFREGITTGLLRFMPKLKPKSKSQLKAQTLFWLLEDSSYPTIHRALQLIQSDDPNLKLQATKDIRHLALTRSFQLQLSSSIKPLISMFRIDLPESHHKSIFRTLISLADNEEKNKINIVEAGALEPIISFLQSQCLNLQRFAAATLFTLSTTTINKPVIGSSGAIPLLLKILRHGNPQAKIDAIGTLLNLSECPDNLNIILGTIPIPLIVNFLKTCIKSSKLVEKCSAFIESLVGFDEGRIALASEKGGVLAVVEVLENGSLQSQEHMVGVLLTMCQSDKCKYREAILREGIIPRLEKLTIHGTAKSKLKAQILLLLLRDSLYSQRVPRVTLYRLNNNGEWVDGRICYVTTDYLKGSKAPGLFIVSEEDGGISLLQSISSLDVYKRHEDTVISWRDLTYATGLSLTFQETIECSYIWDHICSVQRNLHFNALTTSLRRINGCTREINNTNSNVSSRESNDSNSNVSSYEKVTLEWIFVITNFILELPSAVFDQLSSVHEPEYVLIAMVMSFAAILVCVVELIYKGQKERVVWRRKGRIPWFYYPSPSDKRFGTFVDIIGLGCPIFQFIFTTINYSFICRNVDSPIKICVWPIIFTFGVLCSKFLENPNKTLHQD